MSISQAPTYNLKIVLKETGIKADALRAWERRYGLPMPQRSPGGHRLYSQRDVRMIKWLLARQDEGLSISRAVDAWRGQESAGRDPLTELHPSTTSVKTALPGIESGLDGLRHEWLNGCMAFNEPLAEQVLHQAFALYPVERVCVEILQKGLAEMGELWYAKRATVQQEHFASGLAMRRLNALLVAAPAPIREQVVLIGCSPGEHHAFTSLLMALFLRRRGMNVVYLGADVPDSRFEETVRTVNARLVVLSAQQLVTAAALQQTAASLAGRGVNVAYGGRIFQLHADLQTRISGHFLGGQLTDVVKDVETLLKSPAPSQPVVLPGLDYVESLQTFLAGRSALDAALDQNSRSLNMPLAYANIATHFLSDNISASLRLGEITYLDAEIEWLKNLLANYELPLRLLHEYFKMYLTSVHTELGGRVVPLEAWLERQVEESLDW